MYCFYEDANAIGEEKKRKYLDSFLRSRNHTIYYYLCERTETINRQREGERKKLQLQG